MQPTLNIDKVKKNLLAESWNARKGFDYFANKCNAHVVLYHTKKPEESWFSNTCELTQYSKVYLYLYPFKQPNLLLFFYLHTDIGSFLTHFFSSKSAIFCSPVFFLYFVRSRVFFARKNGERAWALRMNAWANSWINFPRSSQYCNTNKKINWKCYSHMDFFYVKLFPVL